MSNTVNVNIAASDNGSIDKVTAKAKNLSKELNKAQATASNLGKPAAGTVAYSKAKAQTEEGVYGVARGTIGTGAEGRDFAKQAQGLGGLVHVYATFAANLFAVSAAFTALSKAADYTNMVKGLEQLGASAGRNLGYVSKQVVELTDNAVSLKEAMATVAQTSSAGMSSDQIERLAVVAKQTSQALGRDMADSLNRLSRGISKIEPELLDELGIFVKIDKAATDYARSIGKTVTSLTDFERRQAYAIAALTEAEKKFGNIQIDANPYNQLLASFQNIAYVGGELINTVLGPLAKLLSSSPVALATAMAGIAGMLLKQAIPALTQWRTGLAEAADIAEQKAKRISESLANFKMNKSLDSAFEQDNKALEARARALKLIEDNKLFGKKTATVYDLSDNKSNLDTAKEQTARKLKGINQELEQQQKLLKGLATTEKEEIAIAETKLKQLNHLKTQYALTAVEIDTARTAMAKAESEELKAANPTTKEEQLRMRTEALASRKAQSIRIRAKVVDDTETMGAREAYSNIGKNIKEWNDSTTDNNKKIGTMQTGWLKLSGAISIATNTLGALISAFSSWILIGGVVIAGLQMLNSWLTTNKKQLEAFNSSLDRVKSTGDMVVKTLEGISNKPVLEGLSADSLLAKANALKEVGDAAASLQKNFIKVEDTQSSWSAFWDGAFDLVGYGNFDKLREDMTNSIKSTLDLLGTDSQANASREKIAKALGLKDVSELTSKNIDKAFSDRSRDKLQAVSKALREVGEESSRTANNISGAFSTLDEAIKSYDNIVNSLTPQDNMSKMAIDAAKGFYQLSNEIDGAENALGTFIKLTSDTNKLKLIPEETALQLNALRMEVEQTAKTIEDLKDKEREYRKLGSSAMGGSAAVYNKKADSIKTDYQALEASMRNKIRPLLVEAFEKGSDVALSNLSIGIEQAGAKAGLLVGQAILSGLNSPEAIELQGSYKQEEINISLRVIESQTNLYLSQEHLRLAIEQQTLEDKAARIKVTDSASSQELIKINKALEGVMAAKTVLERVIPAKGTRINANALSNEDVRNNPSLLGAKASLSGLAAAQKTAEGQKRAIAIETELNKNKAVYDIKQKTLTDEKESYRVQIASLDAEIAQSTVYNETSQTARQVLRDKVRALELAQIELNMLKEGEAFEIRMAAAGNDAKKRDAIISDYITKQAVLGAERSKTKIEQDAAAAKETRENAESLLSYKKYEIELEDKLIELKSSSIDMLRDAGLLVESQSVELKAQLDIQKEKNRLELDIAQKLAKKTGNAASDAAIDKEIAQQTELSNITQLQIKLQADYQAALVKTEETLRKLEKTGQFTSDYFSAVYQDFSNKVSDLVKNTKSAADAFNSGFINAIDTSIDKFFDMMQKSELTLKDMVDFMRNALSDVFRDTAAQLLKNTWKDMLKGMLPPSDADKQASLMQEQLTSTRNLINALDRNTNAKTGGTQPPGPTTPSKDYPYPEDAPANPTGALSDADVISSARDAAEQQVSAADAQAKNTVTLGSTLTTFGTDMIKVVSGQMSATEMFGRLVGNFGQIIIQLIAGLGSLGGSGGSSGGGIFGMIAKGVIGYFTGGPVGALAGAAGGVAGMGGPQTAGEMAIGADINSAGLGGFADGGVFAGGTGLSAYTNSIVTSPTLFAFAKGGIPNRGLMGEAGPEAIIPLKRGADGSLGVQGGGGVTNIDINITIENGSVTNDDTKGGSKETASQLGAVIKAVVSQELLKQSRPGGLLAK